ncbi:hypothetical protein LBRM_04_0660 [Leishmania braziliensis MHOM/BR/75/M2904]|uniref:RING-type domain-containing protein n=2 Tax=Leishmania braziliensis TaxID=5660 RepID=A4H3Y1_LEIBR|nr:hypothetical protein LBRM_04_0660 [Leishmania braziliensis MHOM/BR/75/M2904]KAI5689041.1 zinc finger protein [Leishmania braziliensis]CAJ2466109.1 unnamed protein product [Leishmania braziliensis]CAJ2466749.1 unnamed protein product [Leishmania braziliensis]CAM41543.1 hypothetical protein LBRM_04_0660 [Leishmania braziliensis MHOM/BR/75/M2904]SYZ62638.1 Zinc_finger [Leishmania braziliensis MHOM/BR/75/M2904]
MEPRRRPELTFAQARHVNTSHAATATLPVGCNFFASVSSGGSIAMNFLCVAVPVLALVMLILWVARFGVMCLEAQQMRHRATHWGTLPSYAEVQAVAAALRPKRQAQSQEAAEDTTPAAATAATEAGDNMHCIICFSTVVDHLVELLPCGHQKFCAHCLVRIWQCSGMYRRLRCPLCRQPAELLCPVPVADSKPSVDDVLLLRKYNGGFCGTTKLSLLDRCVLRLRVMTHARLLPIVIGLRIVVLHVTMFTYILLPASLTEATGVAQQPPQQTAQPRVPSSAFAAAYASAVHAFTAVVYTAATYADDLFLVAVSIILTGHLLQRALFKDLKP